MSRKEDFINSKYCLAWDEVDIRWCDVEFTWDDVCIAAQIASSAGGDGNDLWLREFDRLDDEKKDRWIKLTCMINFGEGYEKVYEEKKKRGDMTLTAEQIKLTTRTILEVALITEECTNCT